jgi:glycine/D-amino acid oxidase-like deaminating enzyme
LAEVRLLDAPQTREIIPAATGPFLGAMWSPVDAHCQPEKGTRHFADKAVRAGASTVFGVKATAIQQAAGRVTAIETTAGTVQTGAVVVAGGVWTPYLTRAIGVNVPIMPVVMSELETTPVKPLFKQTIRAFGFGSRQRPDGRVVISAGLNAKVGHGVSLSDLNGIKFWLPRAMAFRKALRLSIDVQRIGQQVRRMSIMSPDLIPQTSPEPKVDRPLVQAALMKLQNVVPGLRGAEISRYWAGLVDMTPDGLPVIDNNMGLAGLSVIAGLCGHGFTLGPVLGEVAADLSLNGMTARPIQEFRLSRFRDGTVGKPKMMI